MHDAPPVSLPQLTLARASLEATPMKAAQLLHSVAMSLTLRALLGRHGYGAEDHREGMELLRECVDPDDVVWPDQLTPSVQDAVIEIDSWDERGFLLVEATLSHRFPEQARFVLLGLAPSEGPGAVVGVRHLLDRLDALESGPARERTRKEDRAAIDALEKRGITTKERKRLRMLVDAAGAASVPSAPRRGPDPTDHETRLLALSAWYEEWAAVARAAVLRGDHLARMGLAG